MYIISHRNDSGEKEPKKKEKKNRKVQRVIWNLKETLLILYAR